MKVSTKDRGSISNYENVTHISIMYDRYEMEMDYIDENGERRQGIGDTPEYMVITEEREVLDKIRAEIEEYQKDAFYSDDVMMSKKMVLAIIDKYKAESES